MTEGMNPLEQAAEVLENGWCTEDLHRSDSSGDKFCAVGALAHVLTGSKQFDFAASEDFVDAYEVVSRSDAGKALAETIKEESDYYATTFATARTHAVIYCFNDDQETVEPVVEMMKLAAKKLY